MQTALPDSVKKQAARATELQHAQRPEPAPGNGAEPAKPATPAVGDLDTLKAEVTRLSQAYKTLQQKYNAEVPRYAQEKRELMQSMEQLTKDLEKLRQEKTEAPAPKAAPVDIANLDLTQYFSQADLDLYGDKLLRGLLTSTLKSTESIQANLMDAATKAVRKEIDPIRKEVEGERDRRARQAADDHEAKQAKFVAELALAVPEWESQNSDPGFMAWLDKFDAKHGASRMKLLTDAHEQFDSATTIEIFKAYRENREIGAAPKAPTSSIDPPPGGPAGNTPTGEKRKWTRAQIKQFYTDKATGKYRGKEREAEARQIDADIIAASADGRVTG